MQRYYYLLLPFLFQLLIRKDEIKSWQGIHETPLSRLEQQFADPPVEFANHVIWGWEGKWIKDYLQ